MRKYPYYVIFIRLKVDYIPLLTKALQNDDWRVRSSAIQALSNFNDPDLIPTFITVLQDDDEDVRASAIKALGTIDDVPSVDRRFAVIRDYLLDVAVGVRTKSLMMLHALKPEDEHVRQHRNRTTLIRLIEAVDSEDSKRTDEEKADIKAVFATIEHELDQVATARWASGSSSEDEDKQKNMRHPELCQKKCKVGGWLNQNRLRAERRR